ncbi:MAG: NAD(P)-binding protein [Clostridiales bacterium]|nr:NAD(P)-binding protein [Clostridiales bacterium]
MDGILLKTAQPGEAAVVNLYAGLKRRVMSGERGVCPVELTVVFLSLSQSQSCGKCTPCRVGLDRMKHMLEAALAGDGAVGDISLLKRTASAIADSADCAVGYEAAKLVLQCMDTYQKDFEAHAAGGSCIMGQQSVNCAFSCPAQVDVPGYIALCAEGGYADAIRLIRKDNPFPSACALVCEHPCEEFCRRGIVDEAVNIRAIKRAAVDLAGDVPPEACAGATGKKVAVIGGGPGGLSAAYYLSLMGHKATVFEKRDKLGGMLRYGIPAYRLPDAYLDKDIDAILKTGVEVVYGTEIGEDKNLDDLRRDFDSVLITIGGHGGNTLDIPGEDSGGVISAVKLLADLGDGRPPDFTGKDVVVIGGGNVAMDATRTSIRLGAKSVRCVYRRRIADMTALSAEIEGAIAEGAEIVALKAPVRVESGADGNVSALIVQPQIIGGYRGGRPAPGNADLPEERIPCDVVIVAIGQAIESWHFGESGVELNRSQILTDRTCAVPGMPGVFAGGDCSTGPATVIRAIEAGKVAAANIDTYLGFAHTISVDVTIPPASHRRMPEYGRIADAEREALSRKHDFAGVELAMSREELAQECARCLRCDHYGMGALKDGRVEKW